jgi:hypothetical protein
MACFGRAVWGIFSLLSCGPAVASNPEVLFACGPQGSHYRGDLEGHPWQARGDQPDVGRASLDDPPKLFSAGRGVASGGELGGASQALLCWAGRGVRSPFPPPPRRILA